MGPGTVGMAGAYGTPMIRGIAFGFAMTCSTSGTSAAATGRPYGLGIVAIAN